MGLLRKLNRRVRRLLFKPTNWQVTGGEWPGVRTWRAESVSKAGHFGNAPFRTEADAQAYCDLMNAATEVSG